MPHIAEESDDQSWDTYMQEDTYACSRPVRAQRYLCHSRGKCKLVQ